VSLVVGLIALAAPTGAAAGTLDQSQTNFNAFLLLGGQRQSAQTFTAGLSGNLDQVDVHLQSQAPPGETCNYGSGVIAEIRTLSGTSPSNTSLATATASAFAVPPTFGWVSIAFAAPAEVTAGTRYALVLSAPDASCTGGFYPFSWGAADPDPYPPGEAFVKLDSASAWGSQGDLDHMFKTYVAPPGAGSEPGADGVAPETAITGQPKAKTKKKQATFEFTSTEPGSTLECSLNGAAFTSCTSPLTVKGKKGKNSFAVRAKDAAGNVDATPATFDWKVKKKKKK
jgi:hypothetical protein